MGNSPEATVYNADQLVKAVASGKSGKSLFSVLSSVQKASKEQQIKPKHEEKKMLKLRSNYARNRVVSFGSTFVTFDKNGTASVPSGDKAVIEKMMMRSPGRFFWVTEESPKEVVVQPVVQPPVTLVEELELAVEELQNEEVEEPEEDEAEEELTPTKKPKTRGRQKTPPKKK